MADWFRRNAGVLSMTVAVLTFLGGIGGWIVLTTTQHVTDAVNEAMEPLATTQHVTDAVDEAVEPLKEAVDSLEGTVDSLEGTLSGWKIAIETLNSTVQTLNSTVQTLKDEIDGLDASLDTLNVTFPLFMSCVMALHEPWIAGGRGGGADTWSGDTVGRPSPSHDSLPICRQALEQVSSLAASGR